MKPSVDYNAKQSGEKMSGNLVVFSGQGNLTQKNVVEILNTPTGKRLISEYSRYLREFNSIVSQVAKGKLSVNNSHASILLTFLSNDWFVKENNISAENTDFVTSHSAGIFNAAYFLGQVNLRSILKFLTRRTTLLKQINGYEMFAYVTNDQQKMLSVLRTNKLSLYLSIQSAKDRGTFAARPEDLNRIVKCLQENEVMLKVIPLQLTIPYHTKLLSQYTQRLVQLLDETNCQEGNNDRIEFISPQNLSLKDEIIFEVDNTFNWFAVKNKIINLSPKKVFDTSPNHFILRDLRRMGWH